MPLSARMNWRNIDWLLQPVCVNTRGVGEFGTHPIAFVLVPGTSAAATLTFQQGDGKGTAFKTDDAEIGEDHDDWSLDQAGSPTQA